MVLGSVGTGYFKKKKKKKKKKGNFGQNLCLGCLSAFSGVSRSKRLKLT